MAGNSQAWLARQTGIDPSTISDIIAKAMPNADFAVRIARALDVPVEWLITGEKRPGGTLICADEADWVMVPRYRLCEFTDSAKPKPVETIALRKDWLNHAARSSTGLWITSMPATGIEGIGEEGDDILCRDAHVREQEGTYLYFMDGMPLIRKFVGPTIGQLSSGDRGWVWEPEDPPAMRIAARILGTIKLRPL